MKAQQRLAVYAAFLLFQGRVIFDTMGTRISTNAVFQLSELLVTWLLCMITWLPYMITWLPCMITWLFVVVQERTIRQMNWIWCCLVSTPLMESLRTSPTWPPTSNPLTSLLTHYSTVRAPLTLCSTYRIAGIFRGYKSSWSSLIKHVPWSFIKKTHKFNISCMYVPKVILRKPF